MNFKGEDETLQDNGLPGARYLSEVSILHGRLYKRIASFATRGITNYMYTFNNLIAYRHIKRNTKYQMVITITHVVSRCGSLHIYKNFLRNVCPYTWMYITINTDNIVPLPRKSHITRGAVQCIGESKHDESRARYERDTYT